MNESDVYDLVEVARAVQGTLELTKPEFTAASVGAALRSRSGEIFTGVSIHIACGVGFCAEHAAIAEMVKHRQVEIDSVVSVGATDIIPPCGRCRELMAQLSRKNGATRVILPGPNILLLRDLLPEHWLGPWT